MAKSIDTLITSGENLLEVSEENLLRSIEEAETEILFELMQVFDSVTVTEGKLQNNKKTQNFLLSLEDKIYGALKKSGYPDAIKTFVKSFDLIQENIIDLHSLMNGERITAAQIDPLKRVEVNNTISKLTEAGLAKDFVNPVRQALYRNITIGATISDTQKALSDFVKTKGGNDGQLMRYVKQVSRDSISQFDGLVQAKISESLGLNGGRYVGSLMIDSRAQCKKWIQQNNGLWLYSDLEDEIEWALDKGTYKGDRCSGMIPGTTVDNFAINRGGFNCRHRFIPTFIRS